MNHTTYTYTFSPAEEKAEQTTEQIARASVKDGWLWYGKGPLKVEASPEQMNDVAGWASEHRDCFWASGVFGLSPELFYALRAGSEIAWLNGLEDVPKNPEPEPVSEPSGIEAQVCKDITDRQAIGIKKYGTTLGAANLTPAQIRRASGRRDLCEGGDSETRWPRGRGREGGMSPEAQRIAIAKIHGWKRIKEPHPSNHYAFYNPSGELILFDDSPDWPVDELPNYPADLNAMAEAVISLRDSNMLKYIEYQDHLGYVVARYNSTAVGGKVIFMAEATAAQRAEAFLKTVGKWEEK